MTTPEERRENFAIRLFDELNLDKNNTWENIGNKYREFYLLMSDRIADGFEPALADAIRYGLDTGKPGGSGRLRINYPPGHLKA